MWGANLHLQDLRFIVRPVSLETEVLISLLALVDAGQRLQVHLDASHDSQGRFIFAALLIKLVVRGLNA